jgi:hypothetical protein
MPEQAPPTGPTCTWTNGWLAPARGLAAQDGRLVFDLRDFPESYSSRELGPSPRVAPKTFTARVKLVSFQFDGGSVSLGLTCGESRTSIVSAGAGRADTGELNARTGASGSPLATRTIVESFDGLVLEIHRQDTGLLARIERNGTEIARSEGRTDEASCAIDIRGTVPFEGTSRAELDDFVLSAGADSCHDEFSTDRTY